tara:strand:+ start:14387 stop:14917 length:531 start_codon:yes stop_codon:yes gene_type:complete
MYIALYILAGLIFVILLLALIAPKAYDVSRSIQVNAPIPVVFEYVKYLKKQEEWSPWARKDPNMNRKFTGVDGEVGAINYWNGNKEVGEGEQEITKIIEGERAEGELRFFKPFKSTSDCYLTTEAITDSETKVTWGFCGKNKFPMSIFTLFVSMDKMVGKDFEQGLATLKSIVEKR